MIFSKNLGYSFPEFGWVPAPTYVMRRAMIMAELEKFPAGRAVEIGPGSGAFLRELADKGFTGIGIEQSPEARALAQKVLADVSQFAVCDSLSDTPQEEFDYLFAFEVLEHITDDNDALKKWRRVVKEGGTMMVSVPARMSSWDHSDVWAGHVRRYELSELKGKVESAGFTITAAYSYGWPLANMIKPMRSFMCGRQLRLDAAGSDSVARTNRSGIARKVEGKFFHLYANRIFMLFFAFLTMLQNLVKHRDWGTGYLVVAKKNV